MVVFSSKHRWRNKTKLTMEEIQKEPLIIRERGSGTRKVFTDIMDKDHAPLNIAMELGNTEAIKKSAEANIGVAVISSSSIAREIKDKTLKFARIVDHPIERRLSLILLEKKYISNPLKAFIKILDPEEKPVVKQD